MDHFSDLKSRAGCLLTGITFRSFSWLLPSFVSSRHNCSETSSKLEFRSTAWLDGLRGWAAFIVFNYHFIQFFQHWHSYGYGVGDNRVLLTLPIIRVLIAGSGMVPLFFVISGYSISWSALKALHAGSALKAYRRLGSSALRRPFRLFIPPIYISLVVVICIRLGFFDFCVSHYPGWKNIGHGAGAAFPPISPTAWEQMKHWLLNMQNYIYVLTFDHSYVDIYYTQPAYTIPDEFKYSMILFIVLLSTVELKPWPRLMIFLATVVYSWWYANWGAFCFQAGLTLAAMKFMFENEEAAPNGIAGQGPSSEAATEVTELDISLDERYSCGNTEELEDGVVDEESKGLLNGKRKPRNIQNIFTKETILQLLFVFGVYVLSIPEKGGLQTPTSAFLFLFVPSSWGEELGTRGIMCYGGILVVYSTSGSRLIRSFFSNAFSRYLGRISYGLYLVHYPLLYMVGFTLIPLLWSITNGPVQPYIPVSTDDTLPDPGRRYETRSWYGYDLGIFIGAFFLVPFTVYVADLFARLVDEPLVRLLKSIEDWSLSNR